MAAYDHSRVWMEDLFVHCACICSDGFIFCANLVTPIALHLVVFASIFNLFFVSYFILNIKQGNNYLNIEKI